MELDILKYILTTFLGIIIGSVVTFITKYVNGQKIEREALKALLRNAIVDVYYKYVAVGEIPYYVKESILEIFKVYKALGGNSFVEGLINEIKKWKVLG